MTEIEKELERFIASGKATTKVNSGRFQTTYIDPLKIAKHFAQWQKEQILERMYDWCNCEFYVHPHDCHVIQYVTDKPMDDIDDFVEEFKNKILHFD